MEILNRLLEISIYSTILFLAIAAIKRVFKNKLSPALHFLVWFLLIARLCIPVTIDSGLRLIVILETPVPQTTTQTQETAADPQDNTVSFTTEPQTNTNVQSNTQTQQANINDTTAQIPSSQVSGLFQQIASMKWTDILVAIWLMGILLSGTWMIFTVVRMNRIIFRLGINPKADIQELLEKCKVELGIKRDIPLYLLPKISTPALTIGLRPKLVLPFDIAETLSKQQLEFAIKHELTHYKRKDNLTSLLLRVLETVYWFNPIVWLAGRAMISDMETACDSMVVSTLNKQAKKQYVLTLLDMFSSRKAPQFLLGMALKNTEKVAEKRIRGVYMKNKSKRNIKWTTGFLAAVLVVACFTTACQPTPESEVVANRSELEEKIVATATPSAPYEAPEHWTDTVTRGDLTVSADTDITLPDVTQYPVTILEPVTFSQERLDELVHYFAGDSNLFCWPSVFTKADYEEMLIEAKRGQLIDGKYVKTERTDEIVAELEKKVAAAPEDAPRVYTDTTMTYDIDLDGNINYDAGPNYLNVGIECGEGNEATIFAQNFTSGYGNSTRFSFSRTERNITESSYQENLTQWSESESGFDGYGAILDGINLDKDAARAQAEKVIGDLGIEDMALVDEQKAVFVSLANQNGIKNDQPNRGGYVFEYVRSSGGIAGYQLTSFGTDGYEQPPDYSPPFFQEMLTIGVSANGIESFRWTGLAQVVETVSDNVSLLPFEDIQQALIDQVYYEQAPMLKEFNESEGAKASGMYQTLTVNVLSVKLHVGYISVKNNPRQGMLVPMWVFETSETSEFGDKFEPDTYSGKTYLFNAIDGGVIMPSDGIVAPKKEEIEAGAGE